jgi:hypothetical protein
VNWSEVLAAEVPADVTTVTSTVPVPAGDVAVISVAESTVTALAAVAPKATLVAPVNEVPVITTLVPPPTGPVVGETLVTVGVA